MTVERQPVMRGTDGTLHSAGGIVLPPFASYGGTVTIESGTEEPVAFPWKQFDGDELLAVEGEPTFPEVIVPGVFLLRLDMDIIEPPEGRALLELAAFSTASKLSFALGSAQASPIGDHRQNQTATIAAYCQTNSAMGISLAHDAGAPLAVNWVARVIRL